MALTLAKMLPVSFLFSSGGGGGGLLLPERAEVQLEWQGPQSM